MAERRITQPKNRIETIDVLRGFALVGILYAHIIIWYTGAALPSEIYAKYTGFADGIAMGIFGGLVFGKFFSVFSFLFGLSFYLHFSKSKQKNDFPAVYIWRLFLLFLIGIVHHIFWRGDILAIYAVLGMLLILFRKLPPRVLLVIALVFVINLPTHIYDLFIADTPNSEMGLPMEEEAEAYYVLVKNADLLRVLEGNWNSWPAKIEYQLKSGRLFMTFGFFLLGFYAGCIRIFTEIKRNISKFSSWNKTSGRISLILLLTGYLMYWAGLVSLPEIKIVPEYKWIMGFLFDIYNAGLTIFYITAVVILFNMKVFNKILKPLGFMGRMALTNYLAQTVFGLIIFYQFGFGLFDKTSLGLNMLFVGVIFYLQLNFSKWWLARYSQGPVEWLWRSLTYFRSSPIRNRQHEGQPISME